MRISKISSRNPNILRRNPNNFRKKSKQFQQKIQTISGRNPNSFRKKSKMLLHVMDSQPNGFWNHFKLCHIVKNLNLLKDTTATKLPVQFNLRTIKVFWQTGCYRQVAPLPDNLHQIFFRPNFELKFNYLKFNYLNNLNN